MKKSRNTEAPKLAPLPAKATATQRLRIANGRLHVHRSLGKIVTVVSSTSQLSETVTVKDSKGTREYNLHEFGALFDILQAFVQAQVPPSHLEEIKALLADTKQKRSNPVPRDYVDPFKYLDFALLHTEPYEQLHFIPADVVKQHLTPAASDGSLTLETTADGLRCFFKTRSPVRRRTPRRIA